MVKNDTGEAAIQYEQDVMEILYQSEIDEWMRRKNKYGDNLKKYYDLVFSYFPKVMNNKIETCTTCHSTIQ